MKQPATSEGVSNKSTFFRWFYLVGLGGAILVLALPTLIGSRWIYQPLVNRLAADDFRLAVGSVQLRWFSPIVLRDVAITDANGPELLHIREARTDRGLFASLLSGRRIGKLDIIDPQFEIELLTEGSNLSRLINSLNSRLPDSDPSSPSASTPPNLEVDVVVKGLSVRVQLAEQTKPLVVIPPFDVSVAYRAADGHSKLHIEPTRLLNEVEVTPELMRLGLGYAIPLLAKSAWFDGRVSIATGPIDIPLESPQSAKGTAVITLHEVRSGPTEPAVIQILDFIGQLRGQSSQHELVFIDGSRIDIEVNEQRISHRGMRLGLPKIDPRLQLASKGSVGLEDRSLDLLVEFPIPLAQLARRGEVRELGVPMLEMPIRGSLDEPRADWSALRGEGAELLGLIRDQLGSHAPGTAAVLSGLEGLAEGQADQAIGAAIDLFRELRKKRQGEKSPPSDQTDILPDSFPANSTNPPPDLHSPESTKPKPNRPILDALKKVLRDGTEQK